MTDNPLAVRKYLDKFAEPETSLADRLAASNACGGYATVLCIPAYDESADFVDRLLPLLNATACLVIVVINQPDSLDHPTANNLALHSNLLARGDVLFHHGKASLVQLQNTVSGLVIIDRYSDGNAIPKKQGVGLARKIAADTALRLIDLGIVKDNWIYTTDCDAVLPCDYFLAGRADAESPHRISARLFQFRHLPCDDPAVAEATRLYEYSIRYYVEGLRFAGSPYAFHTIGSILSFSAGAYAEVRGFPKRAGAEDFYLLNKLAKVGDIVTLGRPEIGIASRLSHRVPFGTGPAVQDLIKEGTTFGTTAVYNPEIFQQLKTVLNLFEPLFETSFETLFQTLHEGGFEKRSGGLAPATVEILRTMDFSSSVEKARRLTAKSGDKKQFIRHLHTWFDGFRTLKFIRQLEAQAYPEIPVSKLPTTQFPDVFQATENGNL